MPEFLPLVRIARLQYLKADYAESYNSALAAKAQALQEQSPANFLEALRVEISCALELDILPANAHLKNDLLQFHQSTSDMILKGRCEQLLSLWSVLHQNWAEAESFLTLSIANSTAARDLETLARCLYIKAFIYTYNKKEHYDVALESLEKMFLIADEMKLDELKASAFIQKSLVYYHQKKYDQALEGFWKAYNFAKLAGHNANIPSILIYIGRIHKDQGQQQQYIIYTEMALRGIDAHKHPRMHRQLTSSLPENLKENFAAHDVVVDESRRLLKERQKGFVDFKNQHILLDLALLLIKNVGIRFSKENLVEQVWNQAYDPALHDNLIYVSIKRLRNLLEPDADNPKYILRDRRGYYFSANATVQLQGQLHNIEELSP